MIRLEQVRLDRRLKVAELAQLAGVSKQTIHTIEQQGRASDATLFRLADALEVPASVLLLPAEHQEASS